MAVFPGADWVAAWVSLANASQTFHACGAGWDGVVALVVQAVPRAGGAADDVYVRLVNHQGRWSDGGSGTTESVIADAEFVLRGQYTVWMDLVQGNLPPVKGVAQGALTYGGHVPVALSPVVWVMEFIELAARIDTQFADSASSPTPPTGWATAPETRYAASGSLRIAYSVFGEGPVDLVMVPGLISHVDYAWAEPSLARFLRRLSTFTRTIAYDKRGMGLSDRDPRGDITMADRLNDLDAVMQAAGSPRAVLFAWSEGGPLALLFATTFPERVAALILVNTSPRSSAAPDFPWGVPNEVLQKIFEVVQEEWGTGIGLEVVAPSMADDRRFRRWWGAYQRAAATPGAVTEAVRTDLDVDVRHVLPHVRTPTLILHQKGDLFFPVGCARYMAQQIPGARYVELPGPDHLYWLTDQDRLLTAVKQFLTRIPEGKPLRTGRRHHNRSRAGWEALTDAELDVVRLVAEGLTNPEIARRLHVSPRTVQTHVAHAFGKLGLSRRSELAVEASQHLG